MKKIIELAVQTKYPNNFKDVIKVANATNNPENSLEILMGIFNEPKLQPTAVFPATTHESERNATIVEYDPLVSSYQAVRYSYDSWVTRWAKENEKEPTNDNTVYSKRDGYPNAVQLPSKGIDTCSVERWQEHELVDDISSDVEGDVESEFDFTVDEYIAH